jgi:protein TonB
VQGPQQRLPAQQLITPADYPASTRATGAQGVVGFVLTVGVDGRVADCTVTRSSGSAVLDSATCRLTQRRGRFTPARDSTGNPAAAAIADQVRWTLP